MPTLGDNLSLNALAAATGQTTKSLGNAAGDTSSPINFTQFSITGVTTPTANAASYAFNSSVTVSSNFTGAGTRFLSRIGSRAANFTWSTPVNLTLVTNNGFNRVYTNAFNPGGTGCSASTTRTVTVTFMDTFNTVATNYNTALTTTSFTLFSPPKPSVTGAGLDRPFNPCNSGGGCGSVLCYGASIRLNGNSGSYNGVLGSSLTYYVNGSALTTVAGNTSTYDTPRQYCGNTAYPCYVVNDFSCQSDSISVTTLAYI